MPTPEDHDPCMAQLDAHRGILYKVASSYCPRVEDRNDLIQEITLQVWRSYPRFDGRCKFSTWMYRIALNVAISFHRREKTHPVLVPGGDLLEELAAAPDASPVTEEIRILQGFIEGLEGLDKALVLLYLDDRSHQEIAEILGVSSTNVATKIARIKQRLRRDFAPGPAK